MIPLHRFIKGESSTLPSLRTPTQILLNHQNSGILRHRYLHGKEFVVTIMINDYADVVLIVNVSGVLHENDGLVLVWKIVVDLPH